MWVEMFPIITIMFYISIIFNYLNNLLHKIYVNIHNLS